MATFGVSVFDKDDKLLDSGNAIVPNLAHGQTKSFEALFMGASVKQAAKLRVQFDVGF